MVEVLMRRTIGGAEPEGAIPSVLRRIPIGTLFVADIKDTRRRSVQRHRWWFALLGLVWKNQTERPDGTRYYPSIDALRFAVLTKLGYVDHYKMRDGTAVIVPKSISFQEMDEAEFTKLCDDTTAWLCDEVIPGMQPGGLRNEIAEMVGALELRE